MTESTAKSFVSFTARLRTERFDVTNPEHLEAFMDLHVNGRQHKELRFELEKPYLDVRSMMLSKLAQQYVDGFREANRKPYVKRVRKPGTEAV
jgi:hypothetical protein